MLIEFAVSNFRSIRDLQKLTMRASPLHASDGAREEQNVFEINGLRMLKSKAIVGANGSGKSNIIKALASFANIVRSSVKDDSIIENSWGERFGLIIDWEEEPMLFQIIFSKEETIYRYGFQLLNGSVDKEWLFAIQDNSESEYFHREKNDIRINPIKFIEGQKFVDQIKSGEGEIFRNDSLFLTAASTMGAEISKTVELTIRSILIVNGSSDEEPVQFAMSRLRKEKESGTSILSDFLKAADLGIESVSLDEMSLELINRISQKRSRDSAKAPSTVFTERIRYDWSGERIDALKVPFALWESEGTKKLLGIGALILTSIATGRTLVIDEFDSKLHPNLTLKIVELFNDSETNPNNAQIIFVTHDNTLLKRGKLRRDQITIIDKDRFGVSSLKTLIEFKGVRKDASHDKDYVQGVYGGISYLNDIDDVLLQSLKDTHDTFKNTK